MMRQSCGWPFLSPYCPQMVTAVNLVRTANTQRKLPPCYGTILCCLTLSKGHRNSEVSENKNKKIQPPSFTNEKSLRSRKAT